MQTDTFHQQVWVDVLTNLPANDSTPADRRKSVIVLDLPVEVQPWARALGLPLLADFAQPGNNLSQQPDRLVLLSPVPNTTYRIDPNFDPASQQLQIEVAAGGSLSQVTIWLDGNPLTTLASPPYQAWWTLSAGEHQFWAQGVNIGGEIVKSDVVTITVLGE
jgi:hypothetical protein